jgi:hypothetical protein
MARRRQNIKKGSEGPIFPAPLAAILSAAAILSLSYLWFCGRCEALGMQIQALESKKAELHKRVINEEYKWSNMKSPQTIEDLLHRFNLAMVWPEENRVVRMPNPAAAVEPGPAHARPRDYVQSTKRAVND